MSRIKRTLAILTAFGVLAILMSGIALAQEDAPEEQPVWAFWTLTGICCIIPIVMLIIFILIAIWVYKDAEKRGMSGVLWLIVVILLGIIGLIIYLVVRKPIQPPMPPPGMYPPPGYPPQQPPQQGY